MSSVIKIGHASRDENLKAFGGMAGDQDGKEVCIREWYRGGWNVVLRAKRAAVAEKMARTCETLCRGNLVGYDQYQRNSLRAELRMVSWDAGKLETPCETDCSALMTVCAEAAGVAVPYTRTAGGGENAPVTQNMRQRFFETGEFQVLLDRQFTDCADLLLRGDILVRESGHTVMVLSDGEKAKKRTGESEDADMDIEKLTDEQCYRILEKAQAHAATLPLPETWDAAGQLQRAVADGITDGTRPMAAVTRLEAALMANRAAARAVTTLQEGDDRK